jgi:prepilin peptidase CpaA
VENNMMEMWAIATAALLAGMVDDLRSRKVHNALVLALLGLILLASVYFRGFEGSLPGFSAFLLALVLAIPLFMLGALGGGDVKLFAVFALAVDPLTMFWTLIFSFVWGALFGVLRAALHRNLPSLVRNTYKITTRQRLHIQEFQKIPYTFALLLGWFTQLTLLRAGISL